jgi:exodeoxyribonuclease-3
MAAKKNVRKLICWNVNGIRALEKKGFVKLVTELDADIFSIQETKAQPDQLSEQLHNIEGYESYWHSAERKGYSSVGIYTRIKPLTVSYGMGIKEFDCEGRVLTLEYKDFYLINIYYPNAGDGLKRLDYKTSFNTAMQKYAGKLSSIKSVVMCGDFNVAHKEIDLKNPKNNVKNAGFTPKEREGMDNLISSGFVDTFRMFNQEGGHYTWWSYRFNARAKDIGWRIDYFCVDEKSRDRVKNSVILKDIFGSDHCPIQLDFK